MISIIKQRKEYHLKKGGIVVKKNRVALVK